MRRSMVVGWAVVAAVAVVSTTACTGSTGGQSAETTPRPSASASPSPASTTGGSTGVIGTVAAMRTVTAYPKAAVAAAKHRSATAAKQIQTGPQLAISLADFRYTTVTHKKPIPAVVLSGPGTVIPAGSGGRRWFLATEYSTREEANYVSVFEQGSGARWRKSMEVWLGNTTFPDATVDSSGVAALPDASAAARDTAALTMVSTYLAKGKRSAHLRSAGPESYVRKFLAVATKPKPGGTTRLTCAPTPGTTSALVTGAGTVVVATISCTVAKQARPGWLISLNDRYRALAKRGTNLHAFSARFVDQVALTVSRSGDVRVIGATWASVAVTSH